MSAAEIVQNDKLVEFGRNYISERDRAKQRAHRCLVNDATHAYALEIVNSQEARQLHGAAAAHRTNHRSNGRSCSREHAAKRCELEKGEEDNCRD